ncbi:type 1 glutamine amidotransferase domain-containing protein [Micromonospora polyrhachis]|uniref:Protease I n=1 Tax=Micromonospora polyrhachis TaxID=1282883 RepID=A0A7W7WSQ9_9ACTN|nr:type 1 glutamine amidotransferase domain-containing protein [Micromonospora polyrhachis]MBB4962284.1 protease I [Micromonospora polyrhachis]
MTAQHTPLMGKTVAFLAADGVEEVEYTQSRAAAEQAGAQVDLISTHPEPVQSVRQDINPSAEYEVDLTVSEADASDYDALVLPGGVSNADRLRLDPTAVVFVRTFFEQEKPVAAICHGPWLLVEADVINGRTLTSFPSLRSDITNAGGIWVDEPVHTDAGLVTSRGPADLPAFGAKLVEEFSEGLHVGQLTSI